MKKLLLFLFIFHNLFSQDGTEHNSIVQPDNRDTSAEKKYNKKQEKIAQDHEAQKKIITAKYQAQTKSTEPKDTSSTASTKPTEPDQKSTFDVESFSKKMNNLTAQRQAEDQARQKLWESEDRAAAAVRDEQGLAERIFLGTSADSGTDTEEQLARNKQIVDTNRTRVFEDLTLKAEHFKSLETTHADFFNKNEKWKTLLKLGDTQTFINDPVEKRTEFLNNLKDILENDDTFNITDQEGKNAVRDLLKLTQLHTTGSTELDPNIEQLLNNEAKQADQEKLSDTLKKFLKKTMRAGLEKLEEFSQNIEKIKAELITKLAAVKTVKELSNDMTVCLGAAAVLGLSNNVNTMYEHMKMSMETFAIGAKGAFIGAHLSEHSEISLIRQLQDAFIDTFQSLLPKTTELLKTVEYKNEAESVGSRLNQKFKYKTTELTQKLIVNSDINSPEFIKDLKNLKKELLDSFFQDSRIHELLELINKNQYNNPEAVKEIIKMLQDDANFNITEKNKAIPSEFGGIKNVHTYEYYNWSFHDLGKTAKSVAAAASTAATKINDATSFESTKLTKNLLQNPADSNIDATITRITNELAKQNLRDQRLSSIIDLINKNPDNSAAKKIIEKLTSYNYLENYEQTFTGKWEKKGSGLFSKFRNILKEKSPKTYNFIFSKENDIFEEYKLQTNDPKLNDAQLKLKMDKELKQLEIIKAKKELEAYQEYKKNSGNFSNILDLEQFKKADALLTLEQEMADLIKKEEWNKKDANYAKIRNERSWAEKFIKQLTTDSAADHERTNTRNQVILETNIERMNKDFEIKKQRFDSFKQKYSEFSETAPWKNLLEMNDTKNFINMTYEQRTDMLNQIDSAIQEFLNSSDSVDNKNLSAIKDFIKLNNYYLNNNESLPDAINKDLTSETTDADQTELSNALKAFFKTTVQNSVHMMHVFNENMKDIQGSVTTLEGIKKVKDYAYAALMTSSLVGTAAFFARVHGLVEPMAAIAKISLGVAHVYTEKEAHLSQAIQDTYKDTFSKLLPKSTKLISTTVHVNMGKSTIEFESTSLIKQLMSMNPSNPEFISTLNKLRMEISKRSYSETYRVKRIESLLDIVNSNPESPAAKEIIDLFNTKEMVNRNKILENHVIKKENGKWIITSKKSNSLDLVNKLISASTHDYSRLLKQIKESLQDELSGLSPEQKTKKIQSVLDIINKNKSDGSVSDMQLQPIYPDLFEFLNTATTKPSIMTSTKRTISNFFNRTESKPEKLILGNDFISKENDGKWVLKPREDAELLKTLVKTNVSDNKFNSVITNFNQELTQITDPQILLDRVDSLLDIINQTPNSSAAQEVVKNLNEKILQDKNYSLEQENGKWKLVSQESIKIANDILQSTTVDLKTKTALVQELSALSPELRNKQIQKILQLLNNSENEANSSIIVNLLNSSEIEPKDSLDKAKKLFSNKTNLLGDYVLEKDNKGEYILEPNTKIKRTINSILKFTELLTKFKDNPEELLKNQPTGVTINNVNMDTFRPDIQNIPLNNLIQSFSKIPSNLFENTMKDFLNKINILEKNTSTENKGIEFTIKSLNINTLEHSPYTITKINNEYVLQPKKSSNLSLTPNNTQTTPSPAAKSS